jgi:hypothetical protein
MGYSLDTIPRLVGHDPSQFNGTANTTSEMILSPRWTGRRLPRGEKIPWRRRFDRRDSDLALSRFESSIRGKEKRRPNRSHHERKTGRSGNAALDRVRMLVKGAEVEADITRLLEFAKDTLERVSKWSREK